DDGHGSGVADGEALADLAADVDLAGGGPVEEGVAGDDVVLGGEGRSGVGPQHDPAAREALGEVVVGVPDELEGGPAGEERAEGLPGGAPEGQVDRSVRQAFAVEAADRGPQQRAHRAVGVADRELGRDGAALLDRGPGEVDDTGAEGPLDLVVLLAEADARALHGRGDDVGQVDAGGLAALSGGLAQSLDVAHGLVEGAVAEAGEVLADLFGDVAEEVLHELGAAVVPRAQQRVLRGHAHRAGVEVAHAHHDAARDDQRGRGEAEALGAEQRGDDDVAAGLHRAVDLEPDAVPQAVADEGLLGLGQADLPGRPGVLDRVDRGGAGAAVVAGDEDAVGLGLGDAGGYGADADFADELHVDLGVAAPGVLEVVDELREV